MGTIFNIPIKHVSIDKDFDGERNACKNSISGEMIIQNPGVLGLIIWNN